jgi:hypothetical protein
MRALPVSNAYAERLYREQVNFIYQVRPDLIGVVSYG